MDAFLGSVQRKASAAAQGAQMKATEITGMFIITWLVIMGIGLEMIGRAEGHKPAKMVIAQNKNPANMAGVLKLPNGRVVSAPVPLDGTAMIQVTIEVSETGARFPAFAPEALGLKVGDAVTITCVSAKSHNETCQIDRFLTVDLKK